MPVRIRKSIELLDDYPEVDLHDAGIRVRLHRNESALPAPEHVLQAVRAIDGNLLRRYPTDVQREVEQQLANRLGVPAEMLVLSNGADEILGTAARVFLEPEDEALIVVPTFGMYARVVAIAGGRVRTVPYTSRWRVDVEALISNAAENTRLLFLGHPNNPTGDVLQARDLEYLATALPNVAIAVDEVYLSFSPLSVARYAQRFENLVVIGSLSKSAALAGARVGYAVTSARAAAALRRTLPPYPLAVASLVAAQAYLDDAAATAAFEKRLGAQTKRSLDALEAGIGPFARSIARGPANFVLMEFGERAPQVHRALDRAGIRARTFDSPLLDGAIRFGASSDAETRETIACVRTAMQKENAERTAFLA